mgnify:CR=1 FL=1
MEDFVSWRVSRSRVSSVEQESYETARFFYSSDGVHCWKATLTGVKDYHSLEEFNKDEEKHYAKGYKWNNN